MKEKGFKILGIIFIILLFVAVIVTSVLISNKKQETQNIPPVDQIQILILN